MANTSLRNIAMQLDRFSPRDPTVHRRRRREGLKPKPVVNGSKPIIVMFTLTITKTKTFVNENVWFSLTITKTKTKTEAKTKTK